GDADAAGLNKRAMELRAQQVLNQRADAGRTGECSIEKMPNGSTVYKIHKDGGAGAVFTTERDEQKKVFGPTVIKGPTSLK
ncbi:MAG: hypothetical protein WCL13_04295, partial [bacterium]